METPEQNDSDTIFDLGLFKGHEEMFDNNQDEFDSRMKAIASERSADGELPTEAPIAEGETPEGEEPVAEGEAIADGKAVAEGETVAEGEEPEDEPVAVPALDLKEFKRRIPDANLNDINDVYDRIDVLVERAETLNQFDELVDGDPLLAEYVSRRLGGADPTMAAEAFADLFADTEPDKEDDPSAWAEWKVRQNDKTKALAAQAEQTKAAKARAQRDKEQIDRHYAEFLRANELTEEEASEFVRQYGLLMRGDDQGKRRRDEFDVIYRGLNHDRLLKAALDEQAEKHKAELLEAKNAGIKNGINRSNRKGDTLPKVGGGNPNSREMDSRQKGVYEFVDRARRQDDESWLTKSFTN